MDRIKALRHVFTPKKYVIEVAFGIVLGLFVIGLSQLETRWWVYFGAAFGGGLIFLINTRKEALLVTFFFLSLQIDIYIRPFYGRAGSPGIEIPLVVFAGLALLLWYVTAYGEKKIRTLDWHSPLGLPIVLLLTTSFMSLIPTTEYFVGLSRIIFEVELLFVYWLSFNLVRTQENLERILKLFFLTLAAQSLVYFVQSALGITFSMTGEIFNETDAVPRPGGTVSTNPAGFASFISPILLIAYAMFLSKKVVMGKRYLWILVLLGTAAIGLTYTRAVWSGLVLGLLPVLFLNLRNSRLHTRRVMVIIMIFLIASAIFLPIMINKRLTTEYHEESALDERIRLLLIAVDIIEEHPIAGVGPGAYAHVYKNYLTSETSQGWVYEVHNEFLLRAAETGIPGGVAFVLLLLIALRQAYRLTKSQNEIVAVVAVGWFGGIVSLCWQMAWVPWRGFSYNAMLWCMLGLMDGVTKHLEHKAKN